MNFGLKMIKIPHHLAKIFIPRNRRNKRAAADEWNALPMGGSHTGPLSLPMPGFPTLPGTGKKVSVKDAYLVTVQGDKVSHLRVDSPADGGIPAILAQLGVKMPAR
jgi:hypothetical protein